VSAGQASGPGDDAGWKEDLPGARGERAAAVAHRREGEPLDLGLDPNRKGPQVARFRHGSRVPGWDDSVDPTKAPAGVPDLALADVPADLRAEVEGHMAKYPDKRSAAIPALAAAQQRHGWCSPEAVAQVAAVMGLTPGYLIAVASFYDMLETEPVGRHAVYVCTNISCSLRGGDELLERMEHEVGDDPEFNVRHFECLGACDIAPMASVDGIYVGPIELAEVPELVAQVRAGEPPLPAKQLLRRHSADPGANTRAWSMSEVEAALPSIMTATAGATDPVRPPERGVAGPQMPDEAGDGPSAASEQGPTGPEDETKTQKD
jgi:NADH-quinone oxidoreductase subunit E